MMLVAIALQQACQHPASIIPYCGQFVRAIVENYSPNLIPHPIGSLPCSGVIAQSSAPSDR
ncbi:MAG: hypothetical protein F6K00_09560 [Leptolyngbya sp. SIOISBB]|nr:hypothetical protein [Leptolyngbya sp. SIOISBB]